MLAWLIWGIAASIFTSYVAITNIREHKVVAREMTRDNIRRLERWHDAWEKMYGSD